MSAERALAQLQRDYRTLGRDYDALQDRVRAAILDVIEESGLGSPQHLRLRYALMGYGGGEATEWAQKTVRTQAQEKSADLTPAQRLARIKAAMPADPREWWTGEEADAFIDEWCSLKLPELTMGDGQSELYLFWCVDPRRAAEMLGVQDTAEVNDGYFTIRNDHGYKATFVAADDEKETNSGASA